jgi:hypothetical protein
MKTKIFLVLLVAGALLRRASRTRASCVRGGSTTRAKPVTLNGIVTRNGMGEPARLDLHGHQERRAQVKHWMIETAAPSQLSRHGLKKADFTDGMTAVVKGYQGKNDPGLANGRTLVLKDGRSFYIGSVGGPNDGAEPH